MFLQPITPNLPASQFDFLGVVHGLNTEKAITQQKGACASYEENGKKIPVEINHGVVLIFRTPDNREFVLGKTRVNPAGDNPTELQTSLGDLGDGVTKIDLFKSIKNTLQNNIDRETNTGWDLSQFEISNDYVCHRNKEWNVCYIKMAALYQAPLTEDELKAKLNQINESISNENKYGLYLLSEIVNAAKLTIGLAEGSHKPKSMVTNYLTREEKPIVIFDDYAIATLFTTKNTEELFPQSLKKETSLAPR